MMESQVRIGQRVVTVDAGQPGTVEQVSRNLLIVMDDGRRCVFHASEVTEVCTSTNHDDEILENGCCDSCGTFADQATGYQDGPCGDYCSY